MSTPTVRTLAYYLPQFHPIPENDEWWGKGFTEWTNVVAAKPLWDGHAQPRLPRDLGFYDLRVAETREAQVELARQHGIDGFIYYHYWFNGRRVLERPFDDMLASDTDFPFALCWANEDWRRNWDGRSGEVLIEQTYSEEDDRAHIQWIMRAMRDRRYIRIDGKPLLIVHRAMILPNPSRTAAIWREEARNAGIGEIFLAYSENMGGERPSGPNAIGFDAAVEFAPDWQIAPASYVGPTETHDYLDTAAGMLSKPDPGYRRFPCVTTGFDNSPRRGENSYVLTNNNPDLYKGWVASTIQREIERGNNDVVLFVNAWNEWAEGAILEPCSVWGTKFLEAHAAGVAAGLQPAPAVTQAPVNEYVVAPPAPTSIPGVTVGATVHEGPGLSVALVTNGNPEAMMNTLRSALDTCKGVGAVDFVVVDNGTTDETAAVLEMLEGDVRSVRADTPLTPTAAWMLAKQAARGEYVLLLSTDVTLNDGWLEPVITSLAIDPACVAATPAQSFNGTAFPSQPLTSLSGVCLLVRASTDVSAISEAKYVSEATVTFNATATIPAR